MWVLSMGISAAVVTCALVVQAFSRSYEKAYLAALRSDLRNLAAAQSAYHRANGRFTDDLAALNFHPEPSWAQVVVEEADSIGWRATARDSARTRQVCSVSFRREDTAVANPQLVIRCAR